MLDIDKSRERFRHYRFCYYNHNLCSERRRSSAILYGTLNEALTTSFL